MWDSIVLIPDHCHLYFQIFLPKLHVHNDSVNVIVYFPLALL